MARGEEPSGGSSPKRGTRKDQVRCLRLCRRMVYGVALLALVVILMVQVHHLFSYIEKEIMI